MRRVGARWLVQQEGDNYGYEDKAASASHDRGQEPAPLARARDAPRHKTYTVVLEKDPSEGS